MSNPTMVVRSVHGQSGQWRHCYVWCPGCDQLHPFRVPTEDGVRVPGQSYWDWNGNVETPTFNPSLLCYGTWHNCFPDGKGIHYEVCPDKETCDRTAHYVSPEGPAHVLPCPKGDDGYGNCHSFLRAGRWEFLADSAHRLAGQPAAMVPLPDWMIGD